MIMSVAWVLPEELRQLAEIDKALITEVLSVFRNDTANRIVRLRDALQRGDLNEVKAEAHTLKGSSGQVGADGVCAICRQIEEQVALANPAMLRDLIDHLQTAFDTVCRDMGA